MKLWWCQFKYYYIHKNIEKINIFIGRHMPYQWRVWSLVFATVKACGDTKSPDEVCYKDIYKGLK